MILNPTATKMMKSIIHNQKLKRIPSNLKRLKSICIFNLSRKNTNNPFDDIISPRHPRMKEMCSRIMNLIYEGEIFCFQSKESPSPLMSFKRLYTLMPSFKVRSIENLTSHLQKLIYSSSTSLILIVKIIIKKPIMRPLCRTQKS